MDGGDNAQSLITTVIGEFIGIDLTVPSVGASLWIYFFKRELQEQCLNHIGPASLHGACLLEFKKFELEWQLYPGAPPVRFEVYDGLYNIYPCHKQHGTTVKNLLVCPAGQTDFVYPNR